MSKFLELRWALRHVFFGSAPQGVSYAYLLFYLCVCVFIMSPWLQRPYASQYFPFLAIYRYILKCGYQKLVTNVRTLMSQKQRNVTIAP